MGRGAPVINTGRGKVQIGDYWKSDMAQEHISIKEIDALRETLEMGAEWVAGKRMKARVDNTTLLAAWQNQGNKSIEVSRAAVRLWKMAVRLRIDLDLRYSIPARFGKHDTDLMALPSNVQKDERGQPLKFFSLHPAREADGVDAFAQDLKVTDGRNVSDVLKFYKGDQPSRQVEFGQQVVGHYSCTCPVDLGMVSDFWKSLRIHKQNPTPKIKDRQAFIMEDTSNIQESSTHNPRSTIHHDQGEDAG
ncbi:Hypp637 [Branchiostoma lanceolatum]|uniref:Hypp637 protein n=1 Tax=Branchiostoma lanceolatum TaxID=7740 RepID=A0A8J9VB15_BRALA|nr:Hypp637 [Branchiostoma lanceolatum]